MNLKINDFESLALRLRLDDNFSFGDERGNIIKSSIKNNKKILEYQYYYTYYNYFIGDSYYTKRPLFTTNEKECAFELDGRAVSFVANFVDDLRVLKLDYLNSYKQLSSLIRSLCDRMGYFMIKFSLGESFLMVQPTINNILLKTSFISSGLRIDCDWFIDNHYNNSSNFNQNIIYGIDDKIYVFYDGNSYSYEKFYEMRNFI